ncbi:hypothetical protein KP509_1Z082300 [Ceratopteris richardii]|nr:hypothetical protein KP509_1Z082300 [Ceratopteris richardii]
MMESHLSADVLDLCSDFWHFQSVVKSFSFRQCRPEENRRLRKSSGHSSSTDNQIARGIFRIFDENGDGVVSEHEICRLMEKLGLTAMESGVCAQSLVAGSTSDEDDGDYDLLDAFHVFDKDRDGFICASELQNMIARVDRNGDGHVDFFEFTALLQLKSYPPTF